MPRFPRCFVPHTPLHITQRGHDRKPVFVDEADYRFYLDNLAAAKEDLDVRLLSYCLMPNHVHLVFVPGDETTAVSMLMRILAARQTRRMNRLEHRSGTLWEGRFKASLIDTDAYLLACCRYVDLNPVRAALVETPESYRWSGFRGRIGMALDPMLDEHSVLESLGTSNAQRALAYKEFVEQGISDNELSLIRRSLQRNQLTGNARFRSKIEARLGRRISDKPPGRPKKPVE